MVKNGRGGKLGNAQQVLVLQVIGGVQTAAGQKGILDAGCQGFVIAHLDIEIIHFPQQTVSHMIDKVGQVVAVYFVHRTSGLFHQLIADIRFIGRAVLPCQRLRDNGVPHSPQVGSFGVSQFTGIRNIKNIFQIRPAPAVFVNQGDAL